MIVKQVKAGDVFTLKTEYKAPVARDPDRPLAAPVTLELVQPRAWAAVGDQLMESIVGARTRADAAREKGLYHRYAY